MRQLRRPEIEIGGRRIGGSAPAYIIAEIGTSHEGDLECARELIDRAAEAGVDCAKFQAVFADEIIHPRTGSVELPGGATPLYERFRSVEREASFYAALKEHTEKRGLKFLCTPFGPRSAAMLEGLGVELFKVASPELNYDSLIEQLGGYGKPIILSSGVSTLGDIEHALSLLSGGECALLHCVTSYPAPPEESNLRVMPALEALFGVPVGLSDHSRDPVLVPALAAAMGASVIEKHLTLSHEGAGLDDPIALEPRELRAMVAAVRRAETEGIEATVARLSRGSSPEIVERVLGDGVKRLAPSERDNYGSTNRSIHAISDVKHGTVLTASLVAVLRSEKNLRPGLSPSTLPVILGKRLVRDVRAGEGILWGDLLESPDNR